MHDCNYIGLYNCSLDIMQSNADIFILDLKSGFSGLGKDNCKTRRGTFTFWEWLRVILEVLW